MLEGEGQYHRSPATQGRIVRILTELELAGWDPAAKTLTLAAATHTDLDRSSAHRAYRARAERIAENLGRPAERPAAAASA